MEGKYSGYEWKERAVRAAESYRELARVFSAYVTGNRENQDKDRRWIHVTGKVCAECLKRDYCWKEGNACRVAFAELADVMDTDGRIEKENMPAYFKEECPFFRRIAEEWNIAAFAERLKQTTFQQMMEGKEALVRQLEETANCFFSISQETQRERRMPEAQEKQLAGFMKRYHIRLREVFVSEVRGKGTEWRMQLRSDGRRGISVRLAERLLSEYLGVPVKEITLWSRLISEEEQEMVFREEARYGTITGVARSIKKEQEVSGDSFSFFYETDGEMAMILSDGMGSGEEAEKESEEVLRLLERMLSAGFQEETAIRLINSVLALRAEQKNFATLDISRVNLYSGTCEFIKIGGAATYIKRGRWLECVEAKTLPIGMIQQMDYDSLVKKLYDGDYIIMLSDGVLDAVPEEERECFLMNVIGDDTEQKPQVIAGRILNASLAYQQFEPKDDMTVLVCGIFGQKCR